MKNNIEQFISLLEKKYGPWARAKALFGSTAYGKIAKALSISSSQFSKLLYGTATEGMYDRTKENIIRLIERESIEKAYKKLKRNKNQTEKKNRIKIYSLSLMFSLVVVVGLILFLNNNETAEYSFTYDSHPLESYFYPSSTKFFDSPFVSSSDVLENCPCVGFEGKWILSKSFKLPLPGSKRPGLYYVGKSSDLILRCSALFDDFIGKGSSMMGYEHLKSEIWIDLNQEPLVPKYFNPNLKIFNDSFDQLSFIDNSRFVKVADLMAFNVNTFEIKGDSIIRNAELTGRRTIEINKDIVEKYGIDISYLTKNVLGDLIKTQCEKSFNPYCNPNELKNGSSITFNCVYTIGDENLGLKGGYPYSKSFVLKNQEFSDYIGCECH